ncbi:MAG: hypothetical protein J6C43_02040 [Oscillospiraceae bacterium]|nr:hypothetical protein [Oscillospiraceae bacterium]MBP3520494.1 hypothetical protein [Oscillospiraceae bacterium]
MYNPYLSSASAAESPEVSSPPPSNRQGGLSQLLKGLKLEELDTGDVLLLLILLFLFLDDREDNLELLITLGLMLVL